MIRSRLPKRLFGYLSHYVHHHGDMTFITGANAPFFQSLRDNLLSSLFKYEPTSPIVVWDLGLDTDQRQELEQIADERAKMGGVTIRDYPEQELPPHYNMKCWNYAFKSYCIYHSLRDVKTRFAFWLDAGCGIRGKLDAERTILSMYGFYSPFSSTTVGKLTVPQLLADFYDDKCEYAPIQMLSSGVDGFDIQNPFTWKLVSEWYRTGMVENLLAPQGASLANHRYDQSLLSLVYYSRRKKMPYLCRYYYNIKIHLNKG